MAARAGAVAPSLASMAAATSAPSASSSRPPVYSGSSVGSGGGGGGGGAAGVLAAARLSLRTAIGGGGGGGGTAGGTFEMPPLPSKWDELTDEVWLPVLSFMAPDDIARWRRTCHRFRELGSRVRRRAANATTTWLLMHYALHPAPIHPCRKNCGKIYCGVTFRCQPTRSGRMARGW